LESSSGVRSVDIAAPAVIDSDAGEAKLEEGVGEMGVTERGVDEGKSFREWSPARLCEE
jgi:hypothetical protein